MPSASTGQIEQDWDRSSGSRAGTGFETGVASMGVIERLRENNRLLNEIFGLIVQNKKWWLLPIFFVFSILSMFLALLGGSSVLPAIYALF